MCGWPLSVRPLTIRRWIRMFDCTVSHKPISDCWTQSNKNLGIFYSYKWNISLNWPTTGSPQLGHEVLTKSSQRANGDFPLLLSREDQNWVGSNFGSSTGKSDSGTGTAPQLLQWMMGIGVPQYRCREINLFKGTKEIEQSTKILTLLLPIVCCRNLNNTRILRWAFFYYLPWYGYPRLSTPWIGVLLNESDCLLLVWGACSQDLTSISFLTFSHTLHFSSLKKMLSR